jgi:hypothetical protein
MKTIQQVLFKELDSLKTNIIPHTYLPLSNNRPTWIVLLINGNIMDMAALKS